jgi:adenosylhomocysteine nucleosidase
MKKLFLALLLSHSLYAQNITGILGAFPPEIKLLSESMTDKQDTVISNTRFTKGLLNGKPVVLALTGVGKLKSFSPELPAA